MQPRTLRQAGCRMLVQSSSDVPVRGPREFVGTHMLMQAAARFPLVLARHTPQRQTRVC
jgi:hypothetical protein